MRDGAEGEDRLEAGPSLQLGGEKRPAGGDLGRLRLVLRRHAAHRVGNAGAAQLQSILWVGLVMADGKARLQQGSIEQVAGKIAGERAAGPIGAAEPGRQADDQK